MNIKLIGNRQEELKVSIYKITRLLGPIFYLNMWTTCSFCLYSKTKKKKISRILKNNLRIFKNLNFCTKLKTFKSHFLKFLSFINLPCGRFSRFDVYWLQTNKQTDKPNLYIDWNTWYNSLQVKLISQYQILDTEGIHFLAYPQPRYRVD